MALPCWIDTLALVRLTLEHTRHAVHLEAERIIPGGAGQAANPVEFGRLGEGKGTAYEDDALLR